MARLIWPRYIPPLVRTPEYKEAPEGDHRARPWQQQRRKRTSCARHRDDTLCTVPVDQNPTDRRRDRACHLEAQAKNAVNG
eukprot:SAG11_NODE_1155_length_5660_cov_6.290955_7_plen_81_part_00